MISFFSLSPGVSVLYPGENISFDFGISVDVRKYNDFDNQDNEDIVGHLTIDFLSPSQRYKFSLGGNYLDTKDPASNDVQSNQKFALGERSKSTIFGAVDFLLGSSSTIIFRLDRNEEEYDDKELEQENTERTSFNATYRYKFGQKTSAVFSYQFAMLEYSDEVIPITGEPDDDGNTIVNPDDLKLHSDSDNHSINVGLRWDATAKISGQATAGFTTRDYDETRILSGQLDSESTFSLGSSLVWKAREKTSFNFLLNRSLEDSSFVNSAFVTSTSIGLGMDQKIGKKMHADLQGIFTNNDYDDENVDRTDNKIEIRAGFKI